MAKMKRNIISILVILFIFQSIAIGETINSIIPDKTIWGISRKELTQNSDSDFKTIEIGKTKVLQQSNIIVENTPLDAYFVFGFPTWKADGYTYNGLSKIVYLLSYEGKQNPYNLDEKYSLFVDSLKPYLGEPNSVSKAVTVWNKPNYKIEIGKGNFKKYSGSKIKNVAIVFTGENIPKPVTPPPTVQPTPKYTLNP